MLIVARRAHFYVFVPDDEKLIKLMSTTRIDHNDNRLETLGMSWVTPEVGENIFCCCTHPGGIRAWQVQLEADSSIAYQEVLDIHTRHFECYESIAISTKYIAISSGSKFIQLYNQDGAHIRTLSGVWYRVKHWSEGRLRNGCKRRMFATGEIFVRSSIMGAALCMYMGDETRRQRKTCLKIP
jgi:hypothetical protein